MILRLPLFDIIGDHAMIYSKTVYIRKQQGENSANMTPIVRNALSELRESRDGCLAFERGEYHFYEDGAYERFLAVSNNSYGVKHIAFPIFGYDGLTVDGGGTVFVFHGRVFPFAICDSKGVTLKRFASDRAYSPAAVFKVANKSELGFGLLTDKTLKYRIDNNEVIFERESGGFSTHEQMLSLHSFEPWRVRYLFASPTCSPNRKLAAPFMLTTAEHMEGGIYFRYRAENKISCDFEEGQELLSLLDGGRDIDVIFLADSSSTVIKDITVRRGVGMGVIAQLCEDIEIDGFACDPSYHGDRISVTADALHFVNCSGKLDIHGCDIRCTMDDALNVHGMYTLLCDHSDGKLTVGIGHAEQYHFCPYKKGDRLRLIDPYTLDIKAYFNVDRVQMSDTDGERIFLFGSLEGDERSLTSGMLIEAYQRMPKLHLHSNHFFRIPHVRLSGAGGILMEDNEIDGCCAALLALDLADYWYESGRISELVFRRNTVRGCDRFGGTRAVKIGVSGFAADSSPSIHGRIEIYENTFEDISVSAVSASGVREIVIRDNSYAPKREELILINGKNETKKYIDRS